MRFRCSVPQTSAVLPRHLSVPPPSISFRFCLLPSVGNSDGVERPAVSAVLLARTALADPGIVPATAVITFRQHYAKCLRFSPSCTGKELEVSSRQEQCGRQIELVLKLKMVVMWKFSIFNVIKCCDVRVFVRNMKLHSTPKPVSLCLYNPSHGTT